MLDDNDLIEELLGRGLTWLSHADDSYTDLRRGLLRARRVLLGLE